VHLTSAIERLKSVGLLAPDTTERSLRDVHVGRALTLGMFLGAVDGDLDLVGADAERGVASASPPPNSLIPQSAPAV
jgi:hypothetical protein